MKKILIMSSGMAVGGIYSCFSSLLPTIKGDSNIIHFLSCGAVSEEVKREWKDMVSFYELPEITKIDRLAALVLTGQAAKKVYLKAHPEKVDVSVGQKTAQWLCDRLPSWTQEYDVAIAASELLPTYYVAKKVKARKKVTWLHPRFDYLQMQLDIERKYLDEIDEIVTVGYDCQKALQQLFPEYKNKVVLIPNRVDAEKIRKKGQEEIKEKWPQNCHRIVSVCRLDNSSKRIDRMVKVAALLKTKGEAFDWWIVGDGNARAYTEKLIDLYDVKDCFRLLGKRENPYPYVASADVLVITSQYEGFPIVAQEAAALGVPIIATQCITWEQCSSTDKIVSVSNDDKTVVGEMCQSIQEFFNNKNEIDAHIPYKLFDNAITEKGIEKILKI